MLIGNNEIMQQFEDAVGDIWSVFPHMNLLPRMSSIWKEDLEYMARTTKMGGFNPRRFYADFGDSQLVVYFNGEDVVIDIETKE